MGRGSRRLTTCWIPFGDIPIEQGTLLVCPRGTAASPGPNERMPNDYSQLDVDAPDAPAGASGQFAADPHEVSGLASGGASSWVTEDFRMGDVVCVSFTCTVATCTRLTLAACGPESCRWTCCT